MKPDLAIGTWLAGGINSLSAILFRVTNPVEPLDFQFSQVLSLLPRQGESLDGLGQPANLLEPVADRPAKVFEHIHFDFFAPADRRPSCR